MRPLRSLLFIPGHRGSWAEKGVKSGADALILDLEDAVPDDEKVLARDEVVRSVRRLRESGEEISVYVRLNPLESGISGDDLDVVAVDGVQGFVLPKLYSADDVVRFDSLISHFEHRRGLPAQTFEVVPALETAEAYEQTERIARAPRVATLFAGTGPDGDVARSIGFRFTPFGLETVYLRSRVVLAARAAGLEFPLCGTWQDLNDPEGAVAFANQNRELGFRGQAVIHPAHVSDVNRIYQPSRNEMEFYARMIEAFEEAKERGAAAVSYEGMHIDYAHVKTAREVLATGRHFATSEEVPA